MLGCSVSLAPVFEPVGHLGGGESRGFGQFALLSRRRVGIVTVPVAQHGTALLLETVRRLLAVPNGARQGELASHAVLAHCSQRTAAQFLRFDVVRLERRRLLAIDLIDSLVGCRVLSTVPAVWGDCGARRDAIRAVCRVL